MQKIENIIAELYYHSMDKFFVPENRVNAFSYHLSPTGKYSLLISQYRTTPDTWNYSRGVVHTTADNQIIHDIKRNFPGFWHCFVRDGDVEYLLCGENYLGYNIINLLTGENICYRQAESKDGFCWQSAQSSPDGTKLLVTGCYWGCSQELVIYDFRDKKVVPLPEIKRDDFALIWTDTAGCWLDDTTVKIVWTNDDDDDDEFQERIDRVRELKKDYPLTKISNRLAEIIIRV